MDMDTPGFISAMRYPMADAEVESVLPTFLPNNRNSTAILPVNVDNNYIYRSYNYKLYMCLYLHQGTC